MKQGVAGQIAVTERKALILQKVPNASLPLVIYGISAYAKKVFEYLQQNGIQVRAACVDRNYIGNNKSWNGVPVYPADELNTHFNSFNIILGFTDFNAATNKKTEGCAGIFFLDGNSNFVSVNDLPVIIEGMGKFFKGNSAVVRIKNILHLYFACEAAGVEFLQYNNANDEIHLQTKDGLHLITDSYFWVFNEIFCEDVYATYRSYVQDEYVIFDIGANRGYSALNFALDENCNKVFCFEPDKTTFAFLQKNIALNPKQSKKIEAFNYGLFNNNEMLTFFQPMDGSDAVNTAKKEFIESYWDNSRKSRVTENLLEVKRSSEVVKNLLSQFSILLRLRKIIKIDIEGAEYEVLAELEESGMIGEFSIIFGECHLGMERIEEICGKNFDLVDLQKSTIEGVYYFVLVNKEKNV